MIRLPGLHRKQRDDQIAPQVEPGVDPEPLSDEPFLSRFSRRKAEARQQTLVDSQAPAEAPSVDETPAPPELTDADMPPLESLSFDSDFSGFMSPKVSETLRRQALRKLFLSPEFNVVDGLDEYAEDYTKFEALGDIVTADMKHEIEMQARREAEKAKQALLEDEAPTEPEALADADNAAADDKEPPRALAEAEDDWDDDGDVMDDG
ncbi:MAG: DUF3306 domain-containing protein [Gammaproteobacteria bacterium]